MQLVKSSTQDPTRLYLLHEAVLTALEAHLDAEHVSIKAIEVAIKFLKDNNVALDLAPAQPEAARDALKARISVIPRLTDEELRLG